MPLRCKKKQKSKCSLFDSFRHLCLVCHFGKSRFSTITIVLQQANLSGRHNLFLVGAYEQQKSGKHSSARNTTYSKNDFNESRRSSNNFARRPNQVNLRNIFGLIARCNKKLLFMGPRQLCLHQHFTLNPTVDSGHSNGPTFWLLDAWSKNNYCRSIRKDNALILCIV